MRVFLFTLVAILVCIGAASAITGADHSPDGIPVTLSYKHTPALDACIRGISEGDARIGAEKVALAAFADGEAASAGAKGPVVSLWRMRSPGGIPMYDSYSPWRTIRTPFLFKDTEHFRRFQLSEVPGRIGESGTVAYGGASHLFSFRTAISEPRHVAGQLIGGGAARSVYEDLGSKPEPNWRITLRRRQLDESDTVPEEVRAAVTNITAIRSDRNALAAVEMPLLEAPLLGLTSVTSFLNLTFSTVEPILIDGSALLKRASRRQRTDIERWMKAVSLQCSDAVLKAEEAVVDGMRQRGVPVVPVNRAAFAAAGWIAGMNMDGFALDLDALDAIVDLAWPSTMARPSRLINKVEPAQRKSLLEGQANRRDKEEKAREDAKREASDRADGRGELADAWSELRLELADALERMPPPKPSGLALGHLKPQQPSKLRVEAADAAAALGDELMAILKDVRSCPPEMREGSACEDQIDAWLNVAKARSAQWSSLLPWKSTGSAVDRAVALALPPQDATPRELLRTANQIMRIADAAAMIDGRWNRRLVDQLAGIDLSSPAIYTEDSDGPRVSAFFDVTSVDRWLVRAYRDLGDLDAASARLKLARQHRLTKMAAAGGDEDAPRYDLSGLSEFRDMSLVVGDYAQAWRDHTQFVRAAGDFSSVWCPYGLKTCTTRADIRRAMFFTAQTLATALLDLDAPRTRIAWHPLVLEAIKLADGGGLDRQRDDLMARVDKAIDGLDALKEIKGEIATYRAATAEQRLMAACFWKGCPADWNDEEPYKAPPRVAELYHRKSDHPFNVAVTNRDWEKAKAWLDEITKDGGDSKKEVHDALFPAFKDQENVSSLESYQSFAEILTREAALAGRLDLMRHCLRKDGDTEVGSFAGARIKSINELFEFVISTIPR
ncbi:hypothetical protein [Methylobacterium sp. WL9]|uniref:hypothetical protein n=1 Tax=Methylobacterium sp. WL9 TaxID=2603898 RepID=UPI0011C77A38|nr:hypothetical protein [Methylobacterium sp. WL9]TXN22145.1 hypothetical protein FV217_11755 [Methylobacterium sp. WL9]